MEQNDQEVLTSLRTQILSLLVNVSTQHIMMSCGKLEFPWSSMLEMMFFQYQKIMLGPGPGATGMKRNELGQPHW